MAGWGPEQPYDPTAHQQRIGRGQPPSHPDSQQSYGQPWQPYAQPSPYATQDPDGPPTQPYPPQQGYGPPWQPYGQPPQQPGRTGARHQSHRRSSGAGGAGGRRKVAALVVGGFVLLLIIIGIAAQGGKGTPTGITSSPAPSASPSTNPAIKTATTIAKQPTTAAPTSAAATSSHASQTTPAAAPPPSASTGGCHPLSSSGNCYKAGEFCPSADAGQQGVAQNGEAITCEKNGSHWRWEPA